MIQISFRYFLFFDDGTVVRMEIRKMHDVYNGRSPMVALANQRVRLLSLRVEVEGNRPQEIVGYTAEYISFDDRGYIIGKKLRMYRQPMRSYSFPWAGSRGPGVSPEDRQAEAALQNDELSWVPTAADCTRIERMLWPKG